jgi:hypothetical protein
VSCRTCKFLAVAPDSRGRVIPRTNKGYLCLYEIPDLRKLGLPASVTGSYGFRWPPIQTFMAPEDGEGCPQHASRKEADQ